MKPFLTIGVIGKRRDPHLPTIAALCAALAALGREVLIEDNPAFEAHYGGERVDRDELARRADLAVVVGGDGTLLDAGRDLAAAGVPILGVNQGRLGFMVDLPPEQVAERLPALLDGEYELEERLMLSARLHRVGDGGSAPRAAVNDVVMRNQANIRMLEFESWMGDEFISLHRADGMIVSSPTGSTAYALSTGGPLLHPTLRAMALVPICPHTLSDRPIVIGGDQTVRLVVRGDDRSQAMVTFDGQTSETLQPGDAVEIKCASAPLRLIHPAGYSYFSILRTKLRWGRGQDQLSERA